MMKRITRAICTLGMFASTSAAAGGSHEPAQTPASMKPTASAPVTQTPASLRSDYQNGFKWIRPAETQNIPPATFVAAAPVQPVAYTPPPAPIQPPMQAPEKVSDVGHITVGPKLTTLGYGAEVGTMFNENWGGRANMQYVSESSHIDTDNAKYDAKADWFTTGALVDFYPSSEDGFRVTGGGFLGDNDVSFTANPTNNITIGSTTYTPVQAGTINGKAKTNYFAPYLGLGYSSLRHNWDNWEVAIDAGVKYNGDPDVHMTSSGTVSQADLDQESGRIEDKLDLTKFYPVAGLTLSYKF